MFTESSRYFKQPTVEAEAKNGRKVVAVKFRRLPYVAGKPTVVKGNDRLDMIAQRQFKDATKFWHIADANTELEANELVEETARVIIVPDK